MLTPAIWKKLNSKRKVTGSVVYLQPCRSCCGVVELTGLSQSNVAAAVVAAVHGGFGMIMYYSVTPHITKALRELGFTTRGSFVNQNTYNRVTILSCKVHESLI